MMKPLYQTLIFSLPDGDSESQPSPSGLQVSRDVDEVPPIFEEISDMALLSDSKREAVMQIIQMFPKVDPQWVVKQVVDGVSPEQLTDMIMGEYSVDYN